MAKVDTSHIDSYGFYSTYTSTVGRPSRSRGDGREYHGPCPFCGGTDRFAFWDSGRFSCKIRSSGCQRSGGDVIDFLREYEGLNFFEACDQLGVDPGSEYMRPVDSMDWRETSLIPCEEWQKQASALVWMAQHTLHSAKGVDALNYLRGRGLTDETILQAKLGFILCDAKGRWIEDKMSNWGLQTDVEAPDETLKLPEGILIPWYENNGKTIRRLDVRLRTKTKSGLKYFSILGSEEGLYNIDTINHGCPVVMCESPLDVLSAYQACNGSIAVVATGGAPRGRTEQAVTKLRQASCVLVAFDDDEPDPNTGKRAGDEGAEYWIQNIPQAIRHTPWSHDLNDMLLNGDDIKLWIEQGLEDARLSQLPPTVQKPVTQHTEIKCMNHSLDFEEVDHMGSTESDVCATLEIPVDPSPPHAIPTPLQGKPRSVNHVAKLPQWLIPGTYDWRKQVDRNGIQEMMERRKIALEQIRELAREFGEIDHAEEIEEIEEVSA